MTRYDFSPLFRSTIGFDRMMNLLEETSRRESPERAYPPYNIESFGEDAYRISLAVAGYAIEDLHIEMRENVLTVSGKRSHKQTDVEFLYRGIQDGTFERRFQLADFVQVASAHLENGLLQIDLVREVPEKAKPRRIEVRSGSPNTITGKAKKAVEKIAKAA